MVGRSQSVTSRPRWFDQVAAASVAASGDAMGQQRVNKSTPRRPSVLERNWLDEAIRPVRSRAPETLASTFNPKVAGSIPARPIASERNRDSERQTTQSIREIPKTRTTRKIPRSLSVPERQGALDRRGIRRVLAIRTPLGQHEVNNRTCRNGPSRASNATSCLRSPRNRRSENGRGPRPATPSARV